jgi:hypothetical protein
MTATRCPLCDRPTIASDDERAMQACRDCATVIGIIPMPPPRRPSVPCGRCNHMVFIRVIPREHSTQRLGDSNTQLSAPLYVTHMPTKHEGWFATRPTEVEIEKKGVGLLEAYICKKCGAVEWYCVDAHNIPLGPHTMSEEIDFAARGDGPYR